MGDGTQEKAYMYVDDTINASDIIPRNMKQGYVPIDMASGERLTVTKIAELVLEETGLTTQESRIRAASEVGESTLF